MIFLSVLVGSPLSGAWSVAGVSGIYIVYRSHIIAMFLRAVSDVPNTTECDGQVASRWASGL
jgi:hypothetical protein